MAENAPRATNERAVLQLDGIDFQCGNYIWKNRDPSLNGI